MDLVDVVINSQPVEHQLSGHGRTLKKLSPLVTDTLGRHASRNTLQTVLKQVGLSWKKYKKLLCKANASRRAGFVAGFERLYDQIYREEVRIIIDEAYFH